MTNPERTVYDMLYSANDPYLAVGGDGTELSPYTSGDGTAGLSAGLSRLASYGGALHLPFGRYDIFKTVVLDTSSLLLEGDVWSCNTDPNGVFEPTHGTKLRMRGRSFPALAVGRETDPISGAIIRDLGVQGDIKGMDTRPLVDLDHPEYAAGLCLDGSRVDQCEFSKLAFCGLANGVAATGNAEIDACIFEKINADGCGNGVWFAPRASFYPRFRSCILADTPYYGFYASCRSMHNLEVLDSHFVRNAGAFTDGDGRIHAAVFFDGVSRCAISHCLFDDPGTYWYYEDGATQNTERQPSHRKAVGLYVIGNENRLKDNTFLHSSDDSIVVEGNKNVLMMNIADGSVRIRGEGNVVSSLVFTKPDARLILEGTAKDTTLVIGVPEDRIVKA